MKAKELLKIDFSKHKRILINSVIVYPTKIVTEIEGDSDRLTITGYKDEEEIFFTSYDENEEISITSNIEEALISIRRGEGRNEE